MVLMCLHACVIRCTATVALTRSQRSKLNNVAEASTSMYLQVRVVATPVPWARLMQSGCKALSEQLKPLETFPQAQTQRGAQLIVAKSMGLTAQPPHMSRKPASCCCKCVGDPNQHAQDVMSGVSCRADVSSTAHTGTDLLSMSRCACATQVVCV